MTSSSILKTFDFTNRELLPKVVLAFQYHEIRLSSHSCLAGATFQWCLCARCTALLASRPPGSKLIFAQADEDVENPATSPNIAVKISTSFPSSEIFGIKLVNGHPTQALLSFSNEEPEPVSVAFIGGSLWTNAFPQQGPQNIRNLTTTRYNVEIPAGQSESISYSFATELQPQDLKLNLAAVVTDSEGTPYTLPAFNETVSIVEPDTSIFDPQMYLLPTVYYFEVVRR